MSGGNDIRKWEAYALLVNKEDSAPPTLIHVYKSIAICSSPVLTPIGYNVNVWDHTFGKLSTFNGCHVSADLAMRPLNDVQDYQKSHPDCYIPLYPTGLKKGRVMDHEEWIKFISNMRSAYPSFPALTPVDLGYVLFGRCHRFITHPFLRQAGLRYSGRRPYCLYGKKQDPPRR